MIAYTYEKERENWCVTKRTANVIPSPSLSESKCWLGISWKKPKKSYWFLWHNQWIVIRYL